MKRRQQGVALVMVIMVVAVITVAVAELVSRQQIDIRRAGNVFDQEKAYMLALGGEEFARGWLIRDLLLNPDKRDNMKEIEMGALEPTPFEGGLISGWPEDLQGRLNVNNLLDPKGQVDAVTKTRFENLFTLVGLDPLLVDAVIDWIDKDSDAPGIMGAEDSYYSNLGYTVANRPMTSASELSLIRDIGFKNYEEKLKPYVTALPERTAVNVNTAPAMVLAALVPGFSEADGEDLISLRDPNPDDKVGFKTIDDFLDLPKLSGPNIDPADLDINSSYFLITVVTEWGPSRSQLFSVLKRDAASNTVVSVMRGQGAY